MTHRTAVAVMLLTSSVGAAAVYLAADTTSADGQPAQKATVTAIGSDSKGSTPRQPPEQNTLSPPASPNAVRAVTDEHGSLQSVRGIQGIDQVMLQNLEAVLRMQSRPVEPPKGSVSSAAQLLTNDIQVSDDPPPPDSRQQLLEFELKGS